MFANYVHGAALAVLVFGGIRYAFDVGAPTVGWSRLVAALVLSFALEAGAIYMLQLIRAEE